MNRITPPQKFEGVPCSIVAVVCALKGNVYVGDYVQNLKRDGYATLTVANRFIRANLPIKRRVDFKRGERPLLKDLHFDGTAIVCVLGHYIFLDHEDYWSFFDNEDDEVVTVWEIKGD